MREVQRASDLTFRLFDWGGKDATGKARQLHIEQAMASIHWDAGPVNPIRAEGYPSPGERSTIAVRQELVRCRYFDLEYLRQTEPFSLGGAGRLQVAIGLHGRASLKLASGEEAFTAGDVLVFPAVIGRTICIPDGPFGLLLSSLPHSV